MSLEGLFAKERKPSILLISARGGGKTTLSKKLLDVWLALPSLDLEKVVVGTGHDWVPPENLKQTQPATVQDLAPENFAWYRPESAELLVVCDSLWNRPRLQVLEELQSKGAGLVCTTAYALEVCWRETFSTVLCHADTQSTSMKVLSPTHEPVAKLVVDVGQGGNPQVWFVCRRKHQTSQKSE